MVFRDSSKVDEEEDPAFKIPSVAKKPKRLSKKNNPKRAAAKSEEEATEDESSSDEEWDPSLEKMVDKSKPPKDSCVYCSKVQIVVDGSVVMPIKTVSSSIIQEICQNAVCLDDEKVLKRCFKKVLRYHPQCRDVHKAKLEAAEKELEQKTEKEKEIDDWCYEDVCEFVKEQILEENKPAWFEVLLTYYPFYRPFKHDEEDPEVKLRSTVLKKKLFKTFGNKICFVNIGKEMVGPEPLPPTWSMKDMDDLLCVNQVAISLRQEIKSMKVNKLPEKITVEDLMAGECTAPPMLMKFFSAAIGGKEPTEDDLRKANNLAQDMIYGATDGEVKPSKHLAVALVINTLTKNREAVDLSASHGICCSYDQLKELESRLSFPIDDCPEELIRFVEKQSGAELLDDILHQQCEDQ